MQLDIDQQELLTWVLNIGKAVVILVVAVILGRMVRQWLLKLGMRRSMNVNVIALLGNLLQIAILIFAILLILPGFGVEWTALLTILGTVGLAFSLAAQDLLRNFVAGLYILLEQPFKIGDQVRVYTGPGIIGTVQSIELRVTNLRTEDGEQVVVPNNLIFSNVLVNLSAANLQRNVLDVTLPGGSAAEVSTAISELLRQIPGVAPSPAPATTLEGITAKELKLKVTFWTAPDPQRQVPAQALAALRERFPEAEVAVAG